MIFEESGIRFDFDDTFWSWLCKYDEETDYKKIKIEYTKAVDFIGILNQRSLVLIEVKNFKGHRIANKPRTENGEDSVELEVAQKFRDTFSGIIGGVRSSTHHTERWKNYLSRLANRQCEVHTVLWFEEDKPILPSSVQAKRIKAKGGTYTDILKTKMNWLNCHVLVVDSSNHPYNDSLTVEFLPTIT
jgi:hypothetical protein